MILNTDKAQTKTIKYFLKLWLLLLKIVEKEKGVIFYANQIFKCIQRVLKTVNYMTWAVSRFSAVIVKCKKPIDNFFSLWPGSLKGNMEYLLWNGPGFDFVNYILYFSP